jgi:hypothetical protein
LKLIMTTMQRSVHVRVLTLIALASMFTSAIACERTAEKRVTQLRSAIDKQLQIGCSESDVITFLNRNGIVHSEYKKAGSKEERDFFGAYGRIDGAIRQVHRRLLSRTDVELVFLFDENGKMISYQISKVITSR